jgi:hypothetical protein
MPRCISKCSRTIYGLFKVVKISILFILRSLYLFPLNYLLRKDAYSQNIGPEKNKAPYMEINGNVISLGFVHNVKISYLGYDL